MTIFSVGHVREAFGRAAPTYEAHAGLQRDVAARCVTALAARLATPRARVLDAGAGSGYVAVQTADRALAWDVVAIDIALPMCRLAARYCQRVVHGDMARLPIAGASMSGVISSLALQWVDDPARVLRELARVIRPGGAAVVATFGPETLRELATAFRAADGDSRVTPFASKTVLTDLAARAGWQVAGCAEENHVLHYADLATLMRCLKAIGATDRRTSRRRGLTAPQLFQRAELRYRAAHRTGPGLPATWQVYYLLLQKPG